MSQFKPLFVNRLWIIRSRWISTLVGAIVFPCLLLALNVLFNSLLKNVDEKTGGMRDALRQQERLDNYKRPFWSNLLQYTPQQLKRNTAVRSKAFLTTEKSIQNDMKDHLRYLMAAIDPNRQCPVDFELRDTELLVDDDARAFADQHRGANNYERPESFGIIAAKLGNNHYRLAMQAQKYSDFKSTKDGGMLLLNMILVFFHSKASPNFDAKQEAQPQALYFDTFRPMLRKFMAAICLMGAMIPITALIFDLIKERQSRVGILLKSNGVRPGMYLLVRSIAHYLILSISLIMLVILVMASKSYGTSVNIGKVIFVILTHNVMSVALATIITLITTKLKTAIILSFIYCSVLPIGFMYVPYEIAKPMSFLPFGSTVMLVFRSVMRSADNSAMFLLSDPDSRDFLFIHLAMMIICVLACLYMYYVMDPDGVGGTRHWSFLANPILKAIAKKKNEKFVSPEDEVVELVSDDMKKEDSSNDVREEAKKAKDPAYANTRSLAIQDLVKVFDDGKVAVNQISFTMGHNVVLGLLGPNGAGKTTAMQMITGLLKPTKGKCFVEGIDVAADRELASSLIGYCPQHDIFFNELSVEQHLKTFIMLKNPDHPDQARRLEEILNFVELGPMRSRPAMKLSGGEKRRLSIAIAFSGICKIVVLDEPTTGLDPEVRKFIWSMITKAKQHHSIILSTHSMEEAEALSDRIVIMANGEVKCLGTVLDLKTRFGGFPVFNFSCAPDKFAPLTDFLSQLTNDQMTMANSTQLGIKFHFKGDKKDFARLFKAINEAKEKIGFVNWGITQPSLEQVFVKIVSESAAEG